MVWRTALVDEPLSLRVTPKIFCRMSRDTHPISVVIRNRILNPAYSGQRTNNPHNQARIQMAKLALTPSIRTEAASDAETNGKK
jgi:hypothetical protein